jgi:hypothetical protein
VSKTLTLAADLTGIPLNRRNSDNSLSIPSGTVLTFPDANSNDALAEMVSIISRQALYDNLAVLNYTLADGTSAYAISYGDFAQKTSTLLGTIPTLVSAVIENAAADTIVATFSANVASAANDYKTGFSSTVATVARTISTATRQSDHTVIKFVLASAVTNGQAVRLSFTTNQYSQAAKTGSDLAAQTGGAYLASFTNFVVTNNVA